MKFIFFFIDFFNINLYPTHCFLLYIVVLPFWAQHRQCWIELIVMFNCILFIWQFRFSFCFSHSALHFLSFVYFDFLHSVLHCQRFVIYNNINQNKLYLTIFLHKIIDKSTKILTIYKKNISKELLKFKNSNEISKIYIFLSV